MKFKAGDDVDNDHCIVLTHEFLRCDDAFNEFCKHAEQMIMQGQTRELSYKTYNAYTSFIHHLYEFIMGCHVRDAKNTDITNKKGDQRIKIIEGYVMHHAQRILDQYRDAIRNGTAPSWLNHYKGFPKNSSSCVLFFFDIFRVLFCEVRVGLRYYKRPY